MTEEKASKAETIARSVEKVADSRGLEALGKGLGAGLVAIAWAFGAVGVYFAITAGTKWDGRLYPQTQCFELQEVSGKVYKINTCTGETQEFDDAKG